MTHFSCRHASQLISDAMDRRLSRRERLSLGIHLLICGMCRRYQKHLAGIRRLLRGSHASSGLENRQSPQKLSTQARERIRTHLQAHLSFKFPPSA
jgi:hypothetical protein